MVFLAFELRQGLALSRGTVMCLVFAVGSFVLASSFGSTHVIVVSSGRLFCIASAYIVMCLSREKTHALLSLRGGSVVGAARGSRGSFRSGVASIILRILVNTDPTHAATQVTYIFRQLLSDELIR